MAALHGITHHMLLQVLIFKMHLGICIEGPVTELRLKGSAMHIDATIDAMMRAVLSWCNYSCNSR